MTFGERLKELRTQKDLTQSALAKFLLLNQGTIACYETGKKYPTHENLKRLADFFNVSTDYLMGRPSMVLQSSEDAADYDPSNMFFERLIETVKKNDVTLSPAEEKMVLNIVNAAIKSIKENKKD